MSAAEGHSPADDDGPAWDEADAPSPDAGATTPRHWLIMGPSGAGKTTLSRQMGRLLRLPVIHLDLHYWNPRWVPTPKAEWKEKIGSLVHGHGWVMDGNYGGTILDRLPHTDAVVLLDLNPILCLWRAIRRRFVRADRPDIPEGCPEQFSSADVEFFWWIVSYRWRSRPKVLAGIANHPHVQLITLRSTREVRRFVARLAPTHSRDNQ